MQMAHACDLVRADLPYAVTHPDSNYPTAMGFIPDVDAIAEFIHVSAFRHSDVVIGKPTRHIFDCLMARLVASGRGDVRCDEVAMAGDRLHTDVPPSSTVVYAPFLCSPERRPWRTSEQTENHSECDPFCLMLRRLPSGHGLSASTSPMIMQAWLDASPLYSGASVLAGAPSTVCAIDDSLNQRCSDARAPAQGSVQRIPSSEFCRSHASSAW